MSGPSTDMPTIVIVPGWRNSGPGHWQTLWCEQMPHCVRVEQDDWEFPRRTAWVERLGETVLSASGPVVLVAHSLGCIAVAHLQGPALQRVAGALLVAPADPERRGALCDFAPVPYHRLPYPSVLVASAHDPYCQVRLAGAYARAWGSQFVRLERAGHINVDSGHGPWPQGLVLLANLRKQTLVGNPGGGLPGAASSIAYAAGP